jgi:hypothetical protein
MGAFSLIAREPTRDVPSARIAGVAVDKRIQQAHLRPSAVQGDPLVHLARNEPRQVSSVFSTSERSAPGYTRINSQTAAGMATSTRPGSASK